MSRLGAVVIVALGAVSLGCGGEDPTRVEDAETAPPDTVDPDTADPDTADPVETPEPSGATEQAIDPEWALDFAIMGRETPMTARAELKVVEGLSQVHLAITGRTSGTDFVMIDLTFDSLKEAIGPHLVEFSLPEGGAHVANSSLDDTWYYSQGGQIEVRASADGRIEGSFDIALARGELAPPGEPVVFAPSDTATPLEGRFSGDWVLNCHSRLMGHMALVLGGKFCDELVFTE